jgi:hypothetical protein
MLNVMAPDLALPVPANPSTLLQKVCNDGHRFGKRSLGDNVDTADAEMSIFNDGDTSGKLERFLEGRSLRFNSLKSSVATNLTSLHLDLMLWRIYVFSPISLSFSLSLTHTHTHTHLLTQTQIQAHIQIHIHTYTQTHILTQTQIQAHIQIHIHTYTQTHILTYTIGQNIFDTYAGKQLS